MKLEKYDKYKITKQEVLSEIKGSFIALKKVLYTLKDGSQLIREEIVKNNGNSSAAIVLAITKENKVVLVIQPRVHKENPISLELPAGYFEEGETNEESAKRELLEETGYLAQTLISLGSYYQDQGCSKVKNECFLALNVEKVKNQELDNDEYIEIELVDYKEALNLMDEGIINDAGSIITLEKSKKYIK